MEMYATWFTDIPQLAFSISILSLHYGANANDGVVFSLHITVTRLGTSAQARRDCIETKLIFWNQWFEKTQRWIWLCFAAHPIEGTLSLFDMLGKVQYMI